MASSSTKSNYPKLLYAKGKAPSQKKSMSYYSYLSNFQMVERGIGVDAWDALKKSAVGVIPKFYEKDFIWHAKIVHYLLTHQLVVDNNYEIWSLIDWQPIRLSLIEFGVFTGLNCGTFQDEGVFDVDHTDFWSEMQICTAVGPSLNELRLVLERCKNWSFEKRRMVGFLCILHIGIYGIAPTSRIPLEVAKRVLDLEAFERYPWGRVACKSLTQSIKGRTSYNSKDSYTMEGFVYVLAIWAYESVTGLGEQYGNKIIGEEIPLLSWRGSRKRFEFNDFIIQEKKAHDSKVRVCNFLSDKDSNTKPKWDNNIEDEKLDNLVRDLLHNCVNREAWDVVSTPTCERRKRKEVVPSDLNNSTTKKSKEKMPIGDNMHVDSSSSHGNEISDNTVLTMLKTLTEKVENMETNLNTKLLLGMDTAMDTKIKSMLNPITEKLATFEKEMENFKNQNVHVAGTKEVALSIANDNEEVSSKAMSWMVEMKSTPHDDFPICVAKTMKKENNMKVGDKKIVKTKIQIPHLLDEASGETWSDPIQRHIFKGVDASLDEIAAKLNKSRKLSPPKPVTPPHKRQTKLAASQLFPFVGNSTVKRIITGVTPSITAYDPFADVDTSKIENLLAFQLDIEEKPDRTKDSSVEFYNVITIPRDAWPTPDYGWLTSSHMWCAMRMFHQRSLLNPSPFYSHRIVFLDQWFVKTMVRDYATFNAKTWTATDSYKRVFNGTYSGELVTNKKWLHDVDHIYACHFINKNHWVALDIDIVKEVIHVYDKILTLVEDEKEIKKECRPFAKMIPAILNAMVPTSLRKRSDKQFAIRRLRTAPQNDKPGDCGVYTIKYIECLAIGCTFEGLKDSNIPQLRRKLAAEIYEEVGLPRMRKN